MAVMEHARRYVAAGLSVIPVRADGSKAPAVGKWEPYQERHPNAEELGSWFPDGRPVGVGVVCGAASRNLAVLDFESQAAWDGWFAKLPPHLQPLLATCPIVVTPSGGRHVYCSIAEGWVAGGVLARRADKKVLIEVRGQGHYVVAPGSPMACHKLNVPYRFEAEGWMAPGVPAPVTLEQFTEMCDIAREANEWSPPEYQHTAASPSGGDATGAPGWDFNHRGTWDEAGLFEAGWKWARQSGTDKGTVRRPGKDGVGISGTVGTITSQKNGWPLFWNFSTSAPEFDPERAYTRFAVFAILKHRGDFSAAARDLRSKGYGEREPRAEARYGDMPEPEAAADSSGVDDVAGIDDLKRHGAEVKWVWPKWIQRGVLTAIAAQGGTGKTRFAADLVRRVRQRQPWPDGSDMLVEPGRTVALWVVADNHHDEMVSVCESFGIADCVKVNATKAEPYGGVTLESVEEFLALEARVKAVQPTFVVVDTVGNATDKNLSRQEDAKAFYQPLQILARRQNVAVLCLTHLNAGGKVLGRRALEKVRTCLRMSAPDITEADSKRRLEVVKTNSLPPAPLGVVMGNNGNQYDDQPPPKPEDEPAAGGGESGGKKRSRVAECMDWFREQLEKGAILYTVARNGAEAKGFGSDTFYKAIETLKLEKVKVNNRTWLRFKIEEPAEESGEGVEG